VGALVRDARRRHRVSQTQLARRAQTSQRHVSRIERGDVSPSVATVARLLAALGERLELVPVPGPRDNRSDEELRSDYRDLTASQRLAQTSALSRALTSIAATEPSPRNSHP
jgi:transcriptional regulator with XRE-family HTH domain